MTRTPCARPRTPGARRSLARAACLTVTVIVSMVAVAPGAWAAEGGQERTGTFATLGIAAAVALVCGLIVLLSGAKRDRAARAAEETDPARRDLDAPPVRSDAGATRARSTADRATPARAVPEADAWSRGASDPDARAGGTPDPDASDEPEWATSTRHLSRPQLDPIHGASAGFGEDPIPHEARPTHANAAGSHPLPTPAPEPSTARAGTPDTQPTPDRPAPGAVPGAVLAGWPTPSAGPGAEVPAHHHEQQQDHTVQRAQEYSAERAQDLAPARDRSSEWAQRSPAGEGHARSGTEDKPVDDTQALRHLARELRARRAAVERRDR